MSGQEEFRIHTFPVPDQQVISGSLQPQQLVANGQTFNIVGTVTATMAYKETPVWMVEIPLGLLAAYPLSQLAALTWSNVFLPLMKAFKKGVQESLRRGAGVETTEDAGAAADDAASEAVVDGEIAGDATVDLATGGVALVGLVVLVAISFLWFRHTTVHHNFKVLNLTTSGLCFSVQVTGGSMNLGPAGPAPQPWPYLVPALSSTAPPGITPTQVAHEADLAMVSNRHGKIESQFTLALTTEGSGQPPELLGELVFRVEKGLKEIEFRALDPGLTGSSRSPTDVLELRLPAPAVRLVATYDPAGDPGPQKTGKSTYSTNSLIALFEQ